MPLVELLIILGLILINGVLAMSELAIVSARRIRLQQAADAGSRGARQALALQADPNRFLSTVQIGITLVGVLNGAFSGATLSIYVVDGLLALGLAAETAQALALASVVVVITYLSLVIGELVPKRLALHHPEAVAIRIAPGLALLAVLGRPLVWLLERSTEAMLRLLRIGRSSQPVVSEEEVKAMLAEGAASGVFHAAETAMIEGVLRIADRPVRAIMTPRMDVVWLNAADPPPRLRAAIAEGGHARYPVCRGDLDSWIGVLETKRLAAMEQGSGAAALEQLLTEPLVVPESTPVLRLIERFRTARVHLALVLDEYGSVQGIVTPLDVLEGIAGELPEAHDAETPGAQQRGDGSWLMDGRLGIHEAARLLALDGMDADGDYTTLAGFVLWHLRRLPVPGESLVWQNVRFEVVDLDGRRIDKLLVQRLEAEP